MDSSKNTEEIQIDVGRVFKKIFHFSPFIVLAVVLIGVVTYKHYANNNKALYSSSGKIYIIDENNGKEIKVSLEQLDIGNMLVMDYKELIVSRGVLERVVQNLSLNISYTELQKRITVNNPEDTRIIDITLQYDDREQIQEILNEVERVTCKVLSKKLGTEDPTILEEASEPQMYYLYSPKKYALIYGMGIGVLMAGTVGAWEILNKKLRYESDIVEYLGIEVSGSIPRISGRRMK